MATIGTFTRSENGFTGTIRTLTLNVKARFAAAEKENEKAPDYRVFTATGNTEFGAAWKKPGRRRPRRLAATTSRSSSTIRASPPRSTPASSKWRATGPATR